MTSETHEYEYTDTPMRVPTRSKLLTYSGFNGELAELASLLAGVTLWNVTEDADSRHLPGGCGPVSGLLLLTMLGSTSRKKSNH